MQGRAYAPAYTEEDMLNKMMEWGEDSIYWRTEYECEFVERYIANVFNPEKLQSVYRGLRTRTTFAARGKAKRRLS